MSLVIDAPGNSENSSQCATSNVSVNCTTSLAPNILRRSRVDRPLVTLQAKSWLRVENRHYFHRFRIDDHDLIPDHEIFKAAPFWFDFHDRPRKSGEPHGARHLGAD
jgi:hypothetical protein